jgi:hypothetical protein
MNIGMLLNSQMEKQLEASLQLTAMSAEEFAL